MLIIRIFVDFTQLIVSSCSLVIKKSSYFTLTVSFKFSNNTLVYLCKPSSKSDLRGRLATLVTAKPLKFKELFTMKFWLLPGFRDRTLFIKSQRVGRINSPRLVSFLSELFVVLPRLKALVISKGFGVSIALHQTASG